MRLLVQCQCGMARSCGSGAAVVRVAHGALCGSSTASAMS